MSIDVIIDDAIGALKAIREEVGKGLKLSNRSQNLGYQALEKLLQYQQHGNAAFPNSQEWQPMSTAPMDGSAFYVRYQSPFRWKPYSKKSLQYRAGIKGRWQEMNAYGGWDNTENQPTEWRPHSAEEKSA